MVVVGTLAEDVGRMFGLDVRATDRDGDTTGRSAIANVFVSNARKREEESCPRHFKATENTVGQEYFKGTLTLSLLFAPSFLNN